MTSQEVKERIGEKNWEDFLRFMKGFGNQKKDENGDIVWAGADVKLFKRLILDLWDR